MSQPTYVPVTETIAGESVRVLHRHSEPMQEPKTFPLPGAGYYPPLKPRSYVEDGIHVDQDVEVKMRDGTTIYVDVYRDASALDQKVPTILAWCWFGKRPGDECAEEWTTHGVPQGSHSKMTRFEGPDPAFWCRKGYAVVNADPRGAGNSQGRLVLWGKQDGEDGHDAIEWIAAQTWSSGRVGMFGNSGLAICQWFIAAEQPEHLSCIAPWEGCSDMYREFASENGIPTPGFADFVGSIGRSSGGLIEDYSAMIREYPLINSYWQSKIPDFARITVPAYITGGWSHLHMMGAINGFRRISSPLKWLRVHRDFEWPDTYSWWNIEDLERFFDRYLKGIRNGWEATPKVRIDVMDAYDFDSQVGRPENNFPLDRTVYTKLYLDAEESGDAVTHAGAHRVARFLRSRNRRSGLRPHVHRRHRARRFHQSPFVGRGQRSRRNGSVPHGDQTEPGRGMAADQCPWAASPWSVGTPARIPSGSRQGPINRLLTSAVPP